MKKFNLNFLKKARITLNDLRDDTEEFLAEKFNQSREAFKEGSAWGQILMVLREHTNLILYYIQDSTTELNIYEATRAQSIKSLSRLAGHNPTRAISAKGNIQIVYKPGESRNDIAGGFTFLLNYTRIKAVGEDANSLIYTIILPSDETRLPTNPNDTTTVQVVEGEFETQFRTGSGLPLQSFSIAVKPAIQIENEYVRVYVNDEEWSKYDSLYDMPRGAKAFIPKTGMNGGLDIFFGNGSAGMMPPSGSEIRIEYLVTKGQVGNLQKSERVFFQFLDDAFDARGNAVDLNQYYAATMLDDFSFGAPPESIDFTRLIAPRTSRNFVLANTTNYITFFEKFNIFSVIDAWTTFDDDNLDDDNVVYLLLVPDITRFLGSDVNYFTAPIEAFRLSESMKLKILDLIEESGRKVQTTVPTLVDPILTKYIINLNLGIFEGFDSVIIKNEIIERLSEYFISIRRRDLIPFSDIIRIVDGIEGVDWATGMFMGEANEINQINNPGAQPVGLDNNGNIVIGRNEYPIIRGGFNDRRDVFYEEIPSFDRASSVNINIVEVNERGYNSRRNSELKNRIN